jgi:folate-dependent phosphoribosylglycinamide formyltransferase PurN
MSLFPRISGLPIEKDSRKKRVPMKLTPIFDPKEKGRVMRVAAFMSGSGTNVIRCIERQRELEKEPGGTPFRVVFLFSDRSDGKSSGEKIARDAGIPYISYDIRRFHELKGLKRTTLTPEGIAARREYDATALCLVEAFSIDLIVLAGYMSYLTLNRCVNVHPADLSILTRDGKRRYVGDHAVEDAIASGETTLRSSTIWTDEGVDTGPLLMVSDPLPVELPSPLPDLLKDRLTFQKVVEEHQKQLKEIGDWNILPLTIEMIARGRFSLDKHGNVYVDEQPFPKGYRLSR